MWCSFRIVMSCSLLTLMRPLWSNEMLAHCSKETFAWRKFAAPVDGVALQQTTKSEVHIGECNRQALATVRVFNSPILLLSNLQEVSHGLSCWQTLTHRLFFGLSSQSQGVCHLCSCCSRALPLLPDNVEQCIFLSLASTEGSWSLGLDNGFICKLQEIQWW